MSTPISPVHTRQNVRRALLVVSFLLFPVMFYYLSPYLIIMGAGERTASGSMVVFGVMTLTALVLGRLFCGWVCPAGELGEALFAVQTRKASNGFNWTRWLVWVPWVTVVVLVTLRAGEWRTANASCAVPASTSAPTGSSATTSADLVL